jgi:hypothetical protein
MTGGTIDDGTYFLTAIDLYNGETSNRQQAGTLLFAGNFIQSILVQTGGVEERGSATYVTLDNGLTFSFSCPEPAARSTTYTAGGGTLKWINPSIAHEVVTLTKQ